MPIKTATNLWPPISAAYDREAALPALLKPCYHKTTKRSRIYYAPFYRLFEVVSPAEMSKACLTSGFHENYIKPTPVGIVFDELSPSHRQMRLAFFWLLRNPEAVKDITIVNDILNRNSVEPFYLYDLLTCQPSTPIHELPRTARSRKKHDLIITYLTAMKIAPLHELGRIIGGDCRQNLLDLRGMGYNIVVGVQGLRADFEITISLNK